MNSYFVVIQARMGSSRRPGKINYSLCGEAMLAYQINRLSKGGVDNIVVATTSLPIDNITETIARKSGVQCFRGSEDDVMGRYLACCNFLGATHVVRVGGDDPLLDPTCIHRLIDVHQNCSSDLVYASHRKGWIYGTAAELISVDALSRACSMTNSKSDREHVVSFLKNSEEFSKTAIEPEDGMCRPDIFLSVDYQQDLDLIEQIIDRFNYKGKRYNFTQSELIKLYDSGDLVIDNKQLHSGF